MAEAVVVGRRFTIGVAVVVTCAALASAWTRPVPDAARAALGGVTGAERWGGLRVAYRPPGGAPRTLDFQGVGAAEAEELLAMLAHGLAMYEVPESDAIARAAAMVDLQAATGGAARLEDDYWISELDGGRHYATYLDATSRAEIERVLDAARAGGWQLPENLRIGYEPYHSPETGELRWRSYELTAEPEMRSADIESAQVSFDPNTSQPVVLVSFSAAGAARFCALTARISGRKLAITVGDHVRSAPIINGAICGGRATITMGIGGNPEREADALAQVLSRGDVAPGGELLEVTELKPVGEGWRDAVARLLIGLLLGGGAAAATALTLRLARPRWLPAMPRGNGPFPWRRLAVTLSAPALLLLGEWLTVPGVDRELLEVRVGSYGAASVAMLGVRPVLGAFVLIELVALAVPRLRWRRHDTRGRAGLGGAVAILATALALLQSYFIAVYFEPLDVSDAGWTFRVTFMVTVTTTTLLLAGLAGVIRERGLGSGYGAILGGAILIEVGHLLVGVNEAPLWRSGVSEALGWRPSAHGLMEVLALAAIAALTACVLRWRVGGEGGRLALTSPASGDSPFSSAPGVLAILALLAAIGLGRPLHLEEGMAWVTDQLARPALPLLLCALLAPLWAWILARPALLARRAQQAELTAPTRSDWMRAACVSVYFAAAVTALRAIAVTTGELIDGLTVVVATALALDLISDARAYRGDVAPAGTLHHAQHAAIAEQVLERAGIPCHLHARHLRALGTFFMPYVPISVLVPSERADEARALLDEALRVPSGQPLPPARVATRAAPAPDTLSENRTDGTTP